MIFQNHKRVPVRVFRVKIATLESQRRFTGIFVSNFIEASKKFTIQFLNTIIVYGTTVSDWVPPPRQRVCLPPWAQRGEDQHSFAGEVVGDPVRTTGKKA
jgi:hypothetical protein